MEALLLADAHHGAGVWTVRATAQRYLIHDRRAVDEPTDGSHVRPARGRIVEYARVAGSAGEELRDHLIPRDAERLGGAVQIHAMTALILHLGDQHGLALEARSAGNPIALGKHPDDLRVGVL